MVNKIALKYKLRFKITCIYLQQWCLRTLRTPRSGSACHRGAASFSGSAGNFAVFGLLLTGILTLLLLLMITLVIQHRMILLNLLNQPLVKV